MNPSSTILNCVIAAIALILVAAPAHVSAAVLSSAQLDDVIKQESISSGFSQAEIRAAIQTTIERGFSDSDAVKIVAVSEGVAFVRHESLSYVVTQLLASINGDGESVIALDRNTAPQLVIRSSPWNSYRTLDSMNLLGPLSKGFASSIAIRRGPVGLIVESRQCNVLAGRCASELH